MIDIWFIIFLLLLGGIVGFFAGLLGIGGGGIMVPVLTSLFLAYGKPVDTVVHLALGTSMASIVVTSISSMRAHHKKNGVQWDIVKSIAPGMLLGAFAATFVASSLNSKYLAVFFSIFMAWISAQMFLNVKPKSHRALPGKISLFSAGCLIGAISSLVSIGGGSLTVPFLTWNNVRVTNAIGTSAALALPISLAGTLGYILNGWGKISEDPGTIGFIYLPGVIIISSVSFFMAPLGAKAAHKISVDTLKKIFALLLIALSLKMLAAVM
ncbi:MAG: sulfite exporter TauE/SafE family protein [Spirochaetia bacterium]|nr:sulfite exporter TauE/SafE family protein [Spirochaetia bacterium]